MFGGFFTGAHRLLLINERVEQHAKRHEKSDVRWEELNRRTDQLTLLVTRLEERMNAWERNDHTQRENLILKLRQELANYRPQLPPPGNSQA